MRRARPILHGLAVVAAVTAVAALTGPAAQAQGGDVGGAGSTYYLNDEWSGTANHVVEYGSTGDRAYSGDWDGNGTDTLAVRRGNEYVLSNSTTGAVAARFRYGRADDTTLVGDWNGDGVDTLAVRRGSTYYFTNALKGGDAETVITYGRPDDQVLVGDWNADRRDTLAVRRANTFYFADQLTGGEASRVIPYGRAGDLVYVGDWNADGADTPAVRREARYYVTDRFAPGDADRVLTYGRATDSTLVGDWNGDGRDTLGVRRSNTPEASAAISWAAGSFGTFQGVTYTGTGTREVALPAGAKAGLLVASHSGTGEFRIETLAGGASRDIPVYVTGRYSGTTAFGLDPAQQADRMRVVATGSWSVRVLPMVAAPLLPTSGTGDGVFLYGGGSRTVALAHAGASDFIVAQWSRTDPSRNRLVAQEYGTYAGTGSLAGGPTVLYVIGGKWSIGLR